MVDKGTQGGDDATWWQSITWTRYPTPLSVTLTLSFDKSYTLQDSILIKFKSGRPQYMVLEKSMDFGSTWDVWQVYNKNCKQFFERGYNKSVTKDYPDSVVCSQRYSQFGLPYTGGSVDFPVFQERFQLFLGKHSSDYSALYEAFDTTNLVTFLTFTDIRIKLITPSTDGLEVLKQQEDLEKYYYAISDISIVAG